MPKHEMRERRQSVAFNLKFRPKQDDLHRANILKHDSHAAGV